MTAQEKDRDKSSLWVWGVLVLLCVLAYWPMFRNGFVWDDPQFIVKNPVLRSLWPPSRFFQSQGSAAEGAIYPLTGQRPAMLFSLALDYALWKLNPFGYHLTNLLLHLLCVFGVAILFRDVTQSHWAGFLSGALFAVHPGHGEAVIAFLGRSDLLATLFVLIGFLAYSRLSNAQGWRKAFWYGGSLLSFLLACFSKETGLVLLGILVIYEIFVSGVKKFSLLRLLPFLVIGAFYWVYRGKVLGGQGAGSEWWGGSPLKNFLMMFEVYARYLRLLFFPLTLSPLHTVPVPGGVWDGRVVWGAFLLLGSLLGTGWGLRKNPRLGLLASWFLIGLVPVANLIPIPGVLILAERWLYLPSVGACGLGGWGAWLLIQRSKGWTRWAWIGLVTLVFVLFGVRTYLWNPAWMTMENVSRAILAADPSCPTGYFNLGKALGDQGRDEESEQSYRKAIRLSPDYPDAHYNLGNLLGKQGRYEEAEKEFRETIRCQPKFLAEVHYNLGVALWEQGKYEETERELREALRLKPDYAKARNLLGKVLSEPR